VGKYSRILGIALCVLSVLFAGEGFVGAADEQVNTPFENARTLLAPRSRDGFTFAILGDRTGGPESGLATLAQAVVEINRLDPDLVMTVGDLINGYNKEPEWLSQMRAFKRIMARLNMPWYPVAGNHDVYGNRGDRSDRSNESLYKEHFGPLYYSFDYEGTHFVVLYSDENLSFRNPPVDQQMSTEQLDWLRKDLAAARTRRTFVFLHHPRWNYDGDVWEPVHEVLAGSGKVTAVFAGHWHRYRSEGERDGIRYYCMAATGAYKENLPAAGAIDHYNLLSVRQTGWTMVCIPVGATLDPDFVSGQESTDVWAIKDGSFLSGVSPFGAPVFEAVSDFVEVALVNPTSKSLEIVLGWKGFPEEGWSADPPQHAVDLAAGEKKTVRFELSGSVPRHGEPVPELAVEARTVYPLAKGGAQEINARRVLPYSVPPVPEAFIQEPAGAIPDSALRLDGVNDCVVIGPHEELNPDGPFTVECWAKLETQGARAALLAKTERSAYGLFLSDTAGSFPGFCVYFDGKGYTSATWAEGETGGDRWIHFAGVFDGSAVRLFVDGRLVAEEAQSGPLKGNNLPFIVGADVDRRGRPISFSRGLVDEVRISAGAVYADAFEPTRRLERTEKTVLLLHMDRVFGNLVIDSSGRGHHGRVRGGTCLVKID